MSFFMSTMLPLYFSFLTTLVVLAFWYFDRKNLQQQHSAELHASAKERKDLYDRLMAVDFGKYKEYTIEEPVEKPEDPEEVDIEVAQEEITSA